MTTPQARSYWLESDGGRVHIGPASVLLGRSPDCDVVMPDARVSRHHAIFRLTEDGVEVIPFGRQSILVNGEPHAAPAALRAGDRVECFGELFEIVESTPSQAPEAAIQWGVERSVGALFRVGRTPFRVGGSADDDLIIVGWRASVLLLHRVRDSLSLEALRAGVHCRGAELAVGECVPLTSGTKITHADQSLRVVALPSDPTRVTAAAGAEDLPTEAELRFLPRGGRLTLRFVGRECSVYLPDRRCDLMASLLQPPAPAPPGSLLADDLLIARIWPDGSQGRVELNTLIFRIRKDLIKADIDGAALVVREGGGVRMRLAPGAQARVITA